jgi:hypothetical protein
MFADESDTVWLRNRRDGTLGDYSGRLAIRSIRDVVSECDNTQTWS